MEDSFMDWTPTPAFRSSTPNTPIYRMPGAWPTSSPPKRKASEFTCDLVVETPNAKRICRKVYAAAAAVVGHIKQYNVVRFVRSRRRGQQRQQTGNQQSASTGSSRSAPSARVFRFSEEVAKSDSLEIRSNLRHDDPKIVVQDNVHSIENKNQNRNSPTIARNSPEIPLQDNTASADLKSSIRNSPANNHPQNMPTNLLPLVVRPVKASSPPLRRKPKWGIMASAPTMQLRLPTPEPEPQPILRDVANFKQSYDLFENLPELRPSVRDYLTPPPKTKKLDTASEEDVAVIRFDEPPSRERSPSPSAQQLANELQQALYFTDTPSQSGSDDLDTCIPTPAPTPRKQDLEDNATTSTAIPIPPYVFTPPSVRERPIPKRDSRSTEVPAPSFTDPSRDLSHIAPSPIQAVNTAPFTPGPVAASPREELTSTIGQIAQSKLGNLSIKDRTSDRDPPKAGFHSAERLRRLTRQQKLKAQALADKLNNYEIVHLTKEWDDKVRDAVRKGHNKYSASDLARVVPQYAGRGQDNWLNDEAINGYLELITQHGKKDDRDTQTPSFHAFNSFFYTNLSTKGPTSIARWSKRAKINNENLLNVQKVFIPINASAHWTLAVVDPQKKTITHYNSMRSATRGITVCEHVKQWVAMELKGSFKEEEWIIESVGESPQQSNSDDCGVFTITSARQIMLGYTPMSYRSEQIPTQRKRIVAELVHGGLLTSKQEQ